ncbi:MAG: 3-phosphoshikimate 1-carboxyvinyltransferase [Nitrospirae bacterium]|nr:3-phosphoshikimate 1-carboxyvinyltransferase [Nitrospirota bacterium]
MSAFTVKKSPPIKGEIFVPGDKSITHRAILFGGFARGRTVIKGYLPSEDCICTLRAIEEMGVKTKIQEKVLTVQGEGFDSLKEPEKVLNMGNSGTSLRLFTGLLSGLPFFSVLDGDDSLRKRPMARVIEPLARMGAEIRGRQNNRFAPIAISGKKNLKGIEYRLPVASAQIKSAILLAGLSAEGATRIEEPFLSRDHTERMLQSFGAKIEFSPRKASILKSELRGIEINVPGDFSSAAFFIVAATIIPKSSLIIRNVGINSTRIGLLDALKKMGGKISIENQTVFGGEPAGDLFVQAPERLKGIEIREEDIPSMIDELPIFFIAAAFAEGETRVTGAKELRVKESDRIGVMSREIKKLGVEVEELPDGLRIKGGNKFKGSAFSSEGDHRVAMSMAIAALASEGESTIDPADCVSTSFPGFESLLKKVSGS